jgi:hypothetical protein
MRAFFENRLAFAAIVVMFTAAWVWNSSQGAVMRPAGDLLLEPALTTPHVSVSGMLSDRWDGNLSVAHGPTMPPDPWDGSLAVKHGPTMPPDPWDGSVAMKHGPTMPPDPWDGSLAAA